MIDWRHLYIQGFFEYILNRSWDQLISVSDVILLPLMIGAIFNHTVPETKLLQIFMIMSLKSGLGLEA